ncbi:unnamed protein product [Ilex paraguariensis]|uniref:SKP1 component POZ domain-containing protein n=1 Tax=Ilex paraguariensis TaxID=185542 RepID=A0ABC8SLR9_9AQUA
MSSAQKITIKSSDQDPFEVDQAVALESQTIKHMIEDNCADNDIPLPNVTSKILAKVIEYCKKHVETPKTDDRAANDELKAWDAEFVKVDQHTLFDLILGFCRCFAIVLGCWLEMICLCNESRGSHIFVEEIHQERNENEVIGEDENNEEQIEPFLTMSLAAKDYSDVGFLFVEFEIPLLLENRLLLNCNDIFLNFMLAVALESQTIKHMIEDNCADNDIPLPNVTSKILAKVIEYCKKHVETPKTDDRAANDELKAWDAEFVKVDQHTLFDLILVSFLGCVHRQGSICSDPIRLTIWMVVLGILSVFCYCSWLLGSHIFVEEIHQERNENEVIGEDENNEEQIEPFLTMSLAAKDYSDVGFLFVEFEIPLLLENRLLLNCNDIFLNFMLVNLLGCYAANNFAGRLDTKL